MAKGQSETCIFCFKGKDCTALKELYCEKEEQVCNFYKHKEQPDEKGSKENECNY
jgi:hypothetical protein